MSAPIGHNQAPLSEVLPEETAALKKRTEDLIAAAGRAKITDDETAGKLTALAVMVTKHVKLLDETRTARKKPFLEAGREVDEHFGTMIKPLNETLATLRRMSDDWLRQKKAEAAAEAKRQAEEARKAEMEANRLRAIAEMDDDQSAVEAAGDAMAKAQELAARAAEPVKPVIDSGLGAKAHATTVKVVTITDLRAALLHIATISEAEAKEFAQKVYDRLARAKVAVLPGAEITDDIASRFR